MKTERDEFVSAQNVDKEIRRALNVAIAISLVRTAMVCGVCVVVGWGLIVGVGAFVSGGGCP